MRAVSLSDFFLHNNKHVMETKIGHNKRKKLTKKRRKCEMIDSRKHLPGSLSEPGYEAHSLRSANTQLSSRPTLWRQSLDSVTL